MKKKTVVISMVLILVVTGVVGFYAWMSGKARTEKEEASLSKVEKLLNRDLENNYPPTVKEVVKYYSEIVRCFYASSTTDEELEKLGMKAWELFDSELQEANEPESYLINLKAEVDDFREHNRYITGVEVASSVNVDTFQEDGYEFARLNCGYNVSDGSVVQVNPTIIVYLLRRDENRRWKIYGWENAGNVHVE